MVQTPSIIETIVQQHAEEAAFLWLLRDAAASAPHYSLTELAELDERVEAHIDGLRVAGEAGWPFCEASLELGEPGEVFSAGVLALEAGDGGKLEQVLRMAVESEEAFRGLVSALGWVDPDCAQGWLPALMQAQNPAYRRLGLAGCAIWRLDPGPTLIDAVQDDDLTIRRRSLRAVGELKRRDLLPQLMAALDDEDQEVRFWACWSAVLMGETQALERLKAFVNFATPFRNRALQLACRVMDGRASQNWLKGLAREPDGMRWVMIGTGVTGDPVYLSTLVKQMENPELARVAAEAFSLITGVELASHDLEGEAPEGFEAGPTENPDDEDVAMDADEDLPWPNPALVGAWLAENQHRFQPGCRYLLGQPISEAHCRQVLRDGQQRQRHAAALELALLQPDLPLFECRAPGLHQIRQLG